MVDLEKKVARRIFLRAGSLGVLPCQVVLIQSCSASLCHQQKHGTIHAERYMNFKSRVCWRNAHVGQASRVPTPSNGIVLQAACRLMGWDHNRHAYGFPTVLQG